MDFYHAELMRTDFDGVKGTVQATCPSSASTTSNCWRGDAAVAVPALAAQRHRNCEKLEQLMKQKNASKVTDLVVV